MRTFSRALASIAAVAALLLTTSMGNLPRAVHAQGYSTGSYFVPFTGCGQSVSGNGTGTQGFTTAGASATPVDQASTSASGTNTHTFVCDITPTSRVVSGNGTSIVDVVFFYGVQTTGLGTQVATLASGTMNSSIVFSKILMPTAGASETPSTVTPVRADSGSLTITPAVASFNVATTTAGGFYSVTFTPATAIVTAALTKYFLTVSLLNTATSATVTNTPGLVVHTL
jgi:hypothetical protein